jgi:hypothetical protein
MRFIAPVLAALTLSCGPPPNADPPVAPAPGDVGAVCRCGAAGGPACAAVACKPTLVCGYPCGMEGCNSVCMTHQEHDKPSPIP